MLWMCRSVVLSSKWSNSVRLLLYVFRSSKPCPRVSISSSTYLIHPALISGQINSEFNPMFYKHACYFTVLSSERGVCDYLVNAAATTDLLWNPRKFRRQDKEGKRKRRSSNSVFRVATGSRSRVGKASTQQYPPGSHNLWKFGVNINVSRYSPLGLSVNAVYKFWPHL